MTNPILQVFLATLFLTLTIAYAGWVKLRAVWIRQTMFDIRDDLWEKARELVCLDDPAYLEARLKLNALIKNAHQMSLPGLITTLLHCQENPPQHPLESKNPEMQSAIEAARGESFVAVFNYVYYYRPFSGILWAQAFAAKENLRESISRWLNGDGPRHFDAAVSC